jgi:hypothetical protein
MIAGGARLSEQRILEAEMNSPTVDWTNFFIAEVGASAALAGLVVVAISINLSRILSLPQLPGRAAEALIMLVGVLVLTSTGLVPGLPPKLFGGGILAIGIVTLTTPMVIQLRSWNAVEGAPLGRKYARLIVSVAASLPFGIAGILIMLGADAGLYWAAAGVIISLAAGVFNSWVLLVEILR